MRRIVISDTIWHTVGNSSKIGGNIIIPFFLSRQWYRHICAAIALIACIAGLVYLVLFFDTFNTAASAALAGDRVIALALVTLVAAIIAAFAIPEKYFWIAAGVLYALLITTLTALITSTGSLLSQVLLLWAIAVAFAGIFGWLGMGAALMSLVIIIFSTEGNLLGKELLPTLIASAGLPLIINILAWHKASVAATPGTQALNKDIANELGQVASRSEVIINAIADGLIALDQQGVIRLINPAAQRIIGWGKQDAVALDYKSVLKLVDKTDKPIAPGNNPIAQALNLNQEASATNLGLMTNSDKKIYVAITASPVGQVGSGVIVVFRDITKEKREEREQAEFISTASHEMRTPVAAIEGYLGLALNPDIAQIDDKARDYITKAQISTQHLGHLFHDLLNVTKAEDGRLPTYPKAVDVTEFTAEIIQGLQSKAETKGLNVIFGPRSAQKTEKVNRKLTPVYYANVDNDHLREVIANLFDNAIKYTPSGDIFVDITGDDEHIVISIKDSGLGIPAEDVPHLFQKFYRVDNSNTREIGGTGLGLYLCRRLVEMMNGRIWVDSMYKQGSTFYIQIPRIGHEEAIRLLQENAVQDAKEKEGLAPIATPLAQEQPAPSRPPAAQVQTSPIPAMRPSATQPQPNYQAASPPLQPIVPQQTQPTPPQNPTAPAYARPNIPLSAIEQNPAYYARQGTNGVTIPPRQ